MDITTIIIIVACVVAVGFLFFGVAYFMKLANVKGIQIEDILNSSDKITDIISQVVKTLDLNPQTKSILTIIAETANLAVKYAEQLYKSGQLDKSLRKQEAIKFVETALNDLNIELTPEREVLINGFIEAAVFILPKEVKTDDTALVVPEVTTTVKASKKKNS